MSGGSQQLRLFRRAIRDGATLEEACAASGTLPDGSPIIGPAEGRIYLAADAKNPPPPEAFELIGPAAVKETAMAAAAKKEDGAHEIPQKDFAQAVKIYRQDIKPAQTKQGEFGQEQSTAYKAIKKDCHIQPQAAKMAFKIAEMEEAHRDDLLICLNGLFKELGIVMPRDLVTMAEGTEGGDVIPSGDKPNLSLVTLGDGDDSDLAGAGDDGEDETSLRKPSISEIASPEPLGDDDFEEASEEELARQEGRPGNDDEEQTAEAAE